MRVSTALYDLAAVVISSGAQGGGAPLVKIVVRFGGSAPSPNFLSTLLFKTH